jgi:hypothetical protein
MIYWVIFDGGIGGDGFANMLEHANNIQPADGVLKWRDEVTPSGKIRFWYPIWVEPNQWFRYHPPEFQYGIEELTKTFKTLIDDNVNTVIPVHKSFFEESLRFKYQDIINHPSKKICLYSLNHDRVYQDFIDKQPPNEIDINNYKPNKTFILLPPDIIRKHKISLIDIDRVWYDWDYLNEKLVKLGIDLPKEVYEKYLDVSKRRLPK